MKSLLITALAKGIEGINRKYFEKFLRDQRSYKVHQQARKVISKKKTYVKGIDKQWQVDLANMQEYAK